MVFSCEKKTKENKVAFHVQKPLFM